MTSFLLYDKMWQSSSQYAGYSMHFLAPNTLIHNRYRVDKLVGSGGMGAVYEVIDTRLSSRMALKQTAFGGVIGTPAMATFRRAFEREARLLASLHHPALPMVSDYFEEGGDQFLIMQFIPGADLGEMLSQRSSPFPVHDVLAWADQILDVLEYLHGQQPPIIHRDIKPQNLKPTSTGQIILLDFGLAKGVSSMQSQMLTGRSIPGYTPQYAPLEQIQASGTDPRSDLYALGATIYHLLTNVPPIDSLTRAAMIAHQQADPLRPPHELHQPITEHVSSVIMQALAMWPQDRPASATEMRNALKSARNVSDKIFYSGVSSSTTMVAPVSPPSAMANVSTNDPLTLPFDTYPVAQTSSRKASLPHLLIDISARKFWPLLVAFAIILLFLFWEARRPSLNSGVSSQNPTEVPIVVILPPMSPTIVFTPVSPSATPMPPSATPMPPSATPMPPSATPMPPSATPMPPSATPMPPSATPMPPSATPTLTPLPPLRDLPIPISQLANDTINAILPKFPIGEHEWANVTFVVPNGPNKLSSKCASPEAWPNTFTIPTDNIVQVESVFMLINAGYTPGYNNIKLGMIDLIFGEGKPLSYDLILGKNIREWNIGAKDVVSTVSSPDVTEIYRGVNYTGGIGILDMLKLAVPDAYRSRRLTAVVIRDSSDESVGSQNPCLFIAGLTLRARS